MTLNCVLPRSINAREITLDGVEYVAIDKAQLQAIYTLGVDVQVREDGAVGQKRAPKAHKAAGGGRKVKHPRTSSLKPLPIAAAQSMERAGRPAPMQDAVKAQLAKRGPLTSGELGKLIGEDKMPSIYTALYTMRKSGEIVTEPDENGIRKNALVAKVA